MTNQQTLTTDARTERAAQTLAYFENSDAFTGPDTLDRNAACNRYRERVAALLARSVPVPPSGRGKTTPVDRGDTVLALSFNRHITSGGLADLTPNEITALFGALNTIASITQQEAGNTA